MAAPQGLTFSLAGIALYSNPDGPNGIGGFEVPEALKVGLETWKSVHRIPSTNPQTPATTIVQTFGVFPKTIKFSAHFVGSGADNASRRFYAAQQQQQQVNLIVGSRSWSGVITDYSETLHHANWVEYEIEFEPIADTAGNTPGGQTYLGAQAQLTAQTNQLALYTSSVPTYDQNTSEAAQIHGAIASLETSLNAANAQIVQTQPESSASTSVLISLAQTVTAAIVSANLLVSLTQTLTDPPGVNVYFWATNVLGSLQTYLGTLSLVSGASGQRTGTYPAGTDLFSVASMELGDPTRWSDIAALNNLQDPVLATATTLLLPPLNQQATVTA